MSFKAFGKSVVGLCNSVFGESISYTPSGGSAVTIKAIFDERYIEVDGVVCLKPTLRINLDDLVLGPGKGDTVSIATVTYRVTESQLDGFGGTTLILQKA